MQPAMLRGVQVVVSAGTGRGGPTQKSIGLFLQTTRLVALGFRGETSMEILGKKGVRHDIISAVSEYSRPLSPSSVWFPPRPGRVLSRLRICLVSSKA